jgi:hypothetical protein
MTGDDTELELATFRTHSSVIRHPLTMLRSGTLIDPATVTTGGGDAELAIAVMFWGFPNGP